MLLSPYDWCEDGGILWCGPTSVSERLRRLEEMHCRPCAQNILHRTVANHSPNNVETHPGRPEASTTLMLLSVRRLVRTSRDNP